MDMPRATTIWIPAACLLLITACGGTADGRRASVHCADCEIILRPVGQMSDGFEPGALPDEMVYAVRDSSRRVFTISRKKDAVLVYGEDGTFLRRLGKAGAGPGEFRSIRRVLLGPGDSIYVSDWGLGRLTVYAPDLSLARVQSLAYPPSLILGDGRFVIADHVPAATGIAFPIHVAGADGVLRNSFGADMSESLADMGLITRRWAAAARNGDIWTVAPGRYTLERWDPGTGLRKAAIAIESSWFREVVNWPDDERTRPPAVIEALWEDDAGLIWFVFRDADLDWTAPAPALANVERAIGADEYERTYDWVIEVVDPTAGLVIASKRFRNTLWSRPPSTVVVSARGDALADGATYDVWQPVLRERERTRQ